MSVELSEDHPSRPSRPNAPRPGAEGAPPAASNPPRPIPSYLSESIPTIDGAGPLSGSGMLGRRPSSLFPDMPGYEILAELGRAGMGVVYKARSLREQRFVAVKMLRDGALAEGDQFQRFCTEAQILANLEHPNVIRIHEVGEFEGRLYMALEYAGAGNLSQLLARQRLSTAESLRLIEVVARAMHFVHQRGVLHRDLKPANILLQDPAGIEQIESEERRKQEGLLPAPSIHTTIAPGSESIVKIAELVPKIADFGLSKRNDGGANTITGLILGTPSYMSPEQAQGRHRDLGPTTDVYSLGALLYECLTGHPPFKGATVLDTLDQVRSAKPRSPRVLNPTLGPEVEAVCLKCLEKEPRQRYASALELADELARLRAGKPLRQTVIARVSGDRPRRASSAAAQGLRCLDLGSTGEALVWFAEALRQEAAERDGGDPQVERMLRIRIAVILRQFPRLLQVWPLNVPATRATFSPDGQRIVAAGEDGTLRFLDVDTPRVRTEAIWHRANVNAVAFSADGRWVASASDDATARVWDAESGRSVSSPLYHKQWVTQVAFSPDGRLLATGGVDGGARIWDWEGGKMLHPVSEHGGMLWSLAFSPDGEFFCTTGWDGVVRVWHTATGRPTPCPPLRHRGAVRQAAFSPNGLSLATASDDHTARLWSLATGESPTWPLKHPAPVRRVSFSQDGQLLLTWADDDCVRVWDTCTGRQRGEPFTACVVPGVGERGPEGRRQLECGTAGLIRLWDWGGLPSVDAAGGRWPPPRLESLSPSPQRAAPGLRILGKFPGRDGEPGAIVPRLLGVRADGILSVEAWPDDSLRVRDSASGEVLTPALHIDGEPRRADFLRDGEQLVVTLVNGSIRSWDLTPDTRPAEELLRLAELLSGRTPDGQGNLVDLEAGRLADSWQALRDRHPEAFQVTLQEVEQFHRDAARRCEEVGLVSEAVWHLECLAGSAARWGLQGQVWARAGRWDRAAEAFSAAVDLEPEEPAYWHARGMMHLKLQRWHRAGRDFSEAATLADRGLGHVGPEATCDPGRGGPGLAWRAWKLRAMAQLRLGRLPQALADLKQAVERNPRSAECRAMRAGLMGHFRKWHRSANEFALARELGDRRPWVSYLHALVCLRIGDRDTHAALCREMLAEVEEVRDVELGAWAAWAAALSPEPPIDPERLLYWAERARTSHREPGSPLQAFCHTLVGAGLCRAGRWDSAIRHLENPPVGETSAWDWLFLARAQHAEGNDRTARRLLRAVGRWLGVSSSSQEQTMPMPPRLLWHQWLELKLLRREVEGLCS